MDTILSVNAGSSSVKFEVFGIDKANGLARLVKGRMDGIPARPRLFAAGADGTVLVNEAYAQEDVADIPAGFAVADAWLRNTYSFEPLAAGHRVVHGGPKYVRPVLINGEVLAELESLIPLAPLHQPNNLALIRALHAKSPDLPQIACFDTAFHRGHPALADCYAIPEHFYTKGIRRYGFHGLSFEFAASRLREIAPNAAGGRVIVAHLGNGASMCALLGGRSIESTMGFTALDGLPMGTRPGQIDPGAILYFIEEEHMTAPQLRAFLYGACGLKGLSGISSDVRDLEASNDPRARFALEYFAYRAGLCAGQLAAALRGLDAFVFTGGIGENSASVRASIAGKLGWLGAVLDREANAAGRTSIAGRESRIGLYVIPADEELMIARHTLAFSRPAPE